MGHAQSTRPAHAPPRFLATPFLLRSGVSIAVILSTYNAPALLERVLAGYSAQTHADFELVIADDGSGPPTRDLLDRARAERQLTIRHVWHEDLGFRKCEILNKALAATDREYVIFSDGDCIPRRDFVHVHATLRRPGHFLSGGYLKLDEALSAKLTPDDARAGNATSYAALRAMGLPPSPRMLARLTTSPTLARVLDALTTTRATWNGHNASGWREDLLRANGFDERMGYGGEDRELGERLENAGIHGIQIRHRAVCVHLWHSRGYVKDDILKKNAQIREHTRSRRITVTPHGIRKQPQSAS